LDYQKHEIPAIISEISLEDENDKESHSGHKLEPPKIKFISLIGKNKSNCPVLESIVKGEMIPLKSKNQKSKSGAGPRRPSLP
jgi:hypothetical protein